MDKIYFGAKDGYDKCPAKNCHLKAIQCRKHLACLWLAEELGLSII